MKPEHSRLRQQENEAVEQYSLEQSKQQPTEFATVDELLRHDSDQNPVPPEVADRLNRSIAAEPKPKSWLRKLF